MIRIEGESMAPGGLILGYVGRIKNGGLHYGLCEISNRLSEAANTAPAAI